MPGVPTQFTVADIVLDSLRAAGEPVPDDADLPFFYLGALGPTLGDFLPTRVEPGAGGSNAPLFDVWSPILDLLAGTPGMPPTPGVAANLQKLKNTLQRLRDAIRDEDKLALLDMKSELDALPALISALTAQVKTVSGLRSTIAKAVFGARPRPKKPPATDRHPRDVLHGHRTGAFWDQLHRRATASADPRLRAFGLGACTGYAGALCGNPFINGVVGAPYRNHWWRHRWVSQHVDSWVWGYDRTRRQLRPAGQEIVFPPPPTTTTAGRVPVPPYAAWHNIAGAELQNRFAIGGITPDSVLDAIRDRTALPPRLPDELVTLWLDCYRDTHGNPAGAGVNAAGLEGAYALTWLTTWITTSSALFGATPPNQINDPDGCGERPQWVNVDGSVVVGGTVVPPPDPRPFDPSVAELVSALVAAVLGAAAFVVGGAAAGIALIAAAVALVDDATDPDWPELRCHAGWVDSYLAQLDIAFRDLLRVAGLGPPYAIQLAHNEIQFQTDPTDPNSIVPPDAALTTCRSPSASEGERYPASAWAATASDWARYPTEPPEQPSQISYPDRPWDPRHFLDGLSFIDNGTTAVPRYTSTQINPLDTPQGRPSVLSQEDWKQRMEGAEQGDSPQVPFGNAVDVALTLLHRAPDQPLLDWDLDGDRGVGWPTWVWKTGQPGPVVRE
ncbi:hypothetical protein [Streptomyces hyaluromycini]|uniref:hypothetical protein n=1 Tax=Streptomyces hyaluromycini TaxID=1377993 RepID=UPI000B5C9152|nr:hypothetical protein [Streptomyces hyaluromycini]